MKQREIKFRFWSTDLQSMSTPMELKEIVNNELFEIPMQYTGLKDKNGKEIYDGDVLLVEDYLRVVQWISSTDGWDYTGWYINEYSGDWSVHEVIGNIYENPELLK